MALTAGWSREEATIVRDIAGTATLQLDHTASDFDVTAINARSGETGRLEIKAKGHKLHLVFPDQQDWILVVVRKLNKST